jgi:hypothetical protein
VTSLLPRPTHCRRSCAARRARPARFFQAAIVALQVLPGLAILTATQIVATAALVFFDYGFLARPLSFLPWRRRGPLT